MRQFRRSSLGQRPRLGRSDPVRNLGHCKNCQKQAGTAFTVVIGIPKSAISIQGQLKTFHDTGDTGQPVERNFCPECGSPVTSDVAVIPELTFIKAGTLDDTSWLDPSHRTHAAQALCVILDQTATLFPGSRLRIRFAMRQPRRIGLAFPGSPVERSTSADDARAP